MSSGNDEEVRTTISVRRISAEVIVRETQAERHGFLESLDMLGSKNDLQTLMEHMQSV